MAITFLQISTELSETSKVNQGMYFNLMTLDRSERQVPLAMPIRWKNVDGELAIQYLKWKVQNAIGFL